MSAGHTPGPWTLLVGRGVEVFDNFGEFIMSMNRPSDEVMANARLIAAAPELLEALQFIREHGEEFSGLAAKKAIAAINKATGATP